MESGERLVLHNEMSDSYGLRNGVFGHFAIPLAHDLVPTETFIQLLKDNPYHDTCAFERRLATADSGIRNNVPAKFYSAVVSVYFRSHADVAIMHPQHGYCKVFSTCLGRHSFKVISRSASKTSSIPASER